MNELVVHVVAPAGHEAARVIAALREDGIDVEDNPDAFALLNARRGRTVGPLVLAEEALTPLLIERLADLIQTQPPWSDLPLLIMTTFGGEAARSGQLEQLWQPLANPVLLERPIPIPTLLGSVRAAVRARRRQYQVRDALIERDRALAELQIEREVLQVIFDHTPVGIITATAEGKIARWNRAAEHILRHPIPTSPDLDSYDEWVAYHPDGQRVAGREFPLVRAIAEGKPVGTEEVLYQRGDGTMGWLALNAAPLLDDHGTVQGGVVAVADVDDRRLALDQARASEERFRRLVETASVGVLIGDLRGGISYLNPTLERLLGYTREDVARGEVRWDTLTPPQFAERDREAIAQLERNGAALPYEKVFVSKDGRSIPVLLGTTMLPEPPKGGSPDVAVFVTDLSSLKQTESALVQSEKLAAVGRLAASISHEINNPLEAVTNLLYLIRHQKLPDDARSYLLLAEQEVARVSQIAAQTLRFHRQATKARAVAPRDLVEPVLALYQGRLNNSHIRVSFEDCGSEPVTCMEGDIRQVLNNLVANAIDSMRLGGKLTLRSRNAQLSNGVAGVRISVADTGQGIPEEARRRIFEPFYTTKGINGTGLGLWISHGIVEKHGGRLDVRSRTGEDRHGTVFSLFLPRTGAMETDPAMEPPRRL